MRQVYLSLPGEPTRLISKAPGPGGSAADATVYYEGAAWGPGSHEARIFFATAADLLGGHDEGGLYSYDAETDALSFLAPASPNPLLVGGSCDTLPNDCSGVIAISNDGDRAYIASSVSLTPPLSEAGVANIYLLDTNSEAVSFIAKLPVGRTIREDLDPTGPAPTGGQIAQEEGKPAWQQAQISDGDGRVLVFQSTSNLTGQNPDGFGAVYRYDAVTHQFSCISCGEGVITGGSWLGNPADGSTLNNGLYHFNQSRYLSSDGSRAFFLSRNQIVPGDVNSVTDVYEWHDGSVHLLTTGKSSAPSYFVGASSQGRDVFVNTADRLVASDRDNAYDVYDVRRDGGRVIPDTAMPCMGDQCQGPTNGVPEDRGSASAALSGPPNTASRRHRVCIKHATRAKKGKAHCGKRTKGSTRHKRKGLAKRQAGAPVHRNGK